jgi:hypothetical protein
MPEASALHIMKCDPDRCNWNLGSITEWAGFLSVNETEQRVNKTGSSRQAEILLTEQQYTRPRPVSHYMDDVSIMNVIHVSQKQSLRWCV